MESKDGRDSFQLYKAYKTRRPRTVISNAVDVALGTVCAVFLFYQRERFASFLEESLSNLLFLGLKAKLKWFENRPAGFKLNLEVVSFLERFFQTVLLALSSASLLELAFMTRVWTLALCLSGFFGITLLLAVMSDTLKIATFSVWICYTLSRRIYRWNLIAINRLYHIFRGQHYNVLRDRLDTFQYSTDQLVVGTMFFSVMVFIFPTTAAFHILFSTVS